MNFLLTTIKDFESFAQEDPKPELVRLYMGGSASRMLNKVVHDKLKRLTMCRKLVTVYNNKPTNCFGKPY